MILDNDQTIQDQVLNVPITTTILCQLGCYRVEGRGMVDFSFDLSWKVNWKGHEKIFYTTDPQWNDNGDDTVHVKIYTRYFKNKDRTATKIFGAEYPVRVKEFIDLLDADNEFIEVTAQRECEYEKYKKRSLSMCTPDFSERSSG